MKAMILAAGRGQRMMPLTAEQPKPLLKVNNKPLIQYHIEHLKAAGIEDIVINLAWQGDKIKQYFADGSHFGVNIEYSEECAGGLETAGGIINALAKLGDDFIVINGDIFTDYDVSSLQQLQLNHGEAHIVLVENPEHNPDGDFSLACTTNQSDKYTFSGISRFNAGFFHGLAVAKRPLGPMLKKGLLDGLVSTELYLGQWSDIGTPERLAELNQQLQSQ